MEIAVKKGSLAEIKADVIIVNLFENTKKPNGTTSLVDKAMGNAISEFVIKKDGFKAKFGETYILQTYDKIPASKILVVGLGKKEEFDLNKLRVLASKTIKKTISTLKPKTVASLVLGDDIAGFKSEDCAQMITEGVLLGAYKFDKYKSKKDENKITKFELVEIDEKKAKEIKKGIDKGRVIAQATNKARDLVNEPAGYLTPSKLAETALSIGGIECKIFEKAEVEKLGMGSYLAVSQGSSQPLKFIHMIYKPKGKATAKIALVGKGITFDSGGLDIKPASSMVTMKDDMSGAAAVISVLEAISILKPNVEVHGIIAACENMPGSSAYKPGDVLQAMNGKTIEVDNTDAEGRLTLADALCYAEKIGVDSIVDIATLTGACLVALGYVAAGIMGSSQTLIDNLIKSADKGGERFWQLPLYEEYLEPLKSNIADFRNTGGRWGGASSAGCFLKEFVEKTPWAHIDIAGPAFIEGELRELSKGATGAGVRALVNYVMSLSK